MHELEIRAQPMVEPLLISLRSTRLHLDSDNLAARVSTNSMHADENATVADVLTTVSYISLPNHILERFWLQDFENGTSPSPNLADTVVDSTALHTIHHLLSAAATSFGDPVHSLVHVGKVHDQKHHGVCENDVVADTLSLVGIAKRREGGENAVWFNLGDAPQVARIDTWSSFATRELTIQQGQPKKAIRIDHRRLRELHASLPLELTVGPCEGIIWALNDIRITEVLAEDSEPTPKLIVVSAGG